MTVIQKLAGRGSKGQQAWLFLLCWTSRESRRRELACAARIPQTLAVLRA
jgi:hypothetical protein